MATIIELNEKIALLTSQAQSLRNDAAKYKTIAQEWRTQSLVKCTGVGDKKRRCQDDKVIKAAKATENDNYAATAENQAKSIDAQIQALRDTIKSQNVANQTLAQQGTTADAVEKVASGQAAAIQTAAATKSAAEADAIRSGAEADAETERKKGKVILYVGLGIGAVIIIVVLAVVIPKLKKKKKKS